MYSLKFFLNVSVLKDIESKKFFYIYLDSLHMNVHEFLKYRSLRTNIFYFLHYLFTIKYNLIYFL